MDVMSLVNETGRSANPEAPVRPDGAPVGSRIDVGPIVESVRRAIVDAEAAIENDRSLPPALVDVLYDAGVFLFGHPREVGGWEAHPIDFLELVFQLSRINGSVGWLAMIQGGGGGYPEPDALVEMAEGHRFLHAGSFGRIGRADRVDGGYRFSGRWVFASGAEHAVHFGGLAQVYDSDGEPVIDSETGMPQMVTGFFERAAVTLHDTWDGLGLRGTGSHNFDVDDVFVADRFVTDGYTLVSPAYSDRVVYREYFAMTGHAAHALGVAQGAIDAFVAICHRLPRSDSPRQPSVGRMQTHLIALANAEAMVRAARLLVWDTVERAYECAAEEGAVSFDLRVRMAQANLYGVRVARDATWLIFEQAGTDGVVRGRSLERCFRDISTAAQHVMMAQTMLESVGEYIATKDLPGGPRLDPMKEGISLIGMPPESGF